MEEQHSLIDDLPGDLMIWVLIVSELLVFGAGLWAFLAVRIGDPDGFSASAAALHPVRAGIGTMVLVTSSALAAAARPDATRWLWGAAALGVLFLWLKQAEWSDLAAAGVGTETHAFYTFYYLLTGFHAAHVAGGIVLLGVVALRQRAAEIEAATAFWHMVDLVWIMLYPVIYLIGGMP